MIDQLDLMKKYFYKSLMMEHHFLANTMNKLMVVDLMNKTIFDQQMVAVVVVVVVDSYIAVY
jgi:hypothetical protein